MNYILTCLIIIFTPILSMYLKSCEKPSSSYTLVYSGAANEFSQQEIFDALSFEGNGKIRSFGAVNSSDKYFDVKMNSKCDFATGEIANYLGKSIEWQSMICGNISDFDSNKTAVILKGINHDAEYRSLISRTNNAHLYQGFILFDGYSCKGAKEYFKLEKKMEINNDFSCVTMNNVQKLNRL